MLDIAAAKMAAMISPSTIGGRLSKMNRTKMLLVSSRSFGSRAAITRASCRMSRTATTAAW